MQNEGMATQNPLVSRMLHDDSQASTSRFPFPLVTINTGLGLPSLCPSHSILASLQGDQSAANGK